MAQSKLRWRQRPSHHRIAFIVGSVAYVFAFALGGLTAYGASMDSRILRGVRVGSIDLSGKTVEEAKALVTEATTMALDRGLAFSAEGKNATIPSTVQAKSEVDSAFPLYVFDVESTVALAYEVGRERSALGRLVSLIQSLFGGKTIPASVNIEAGRLIELLKTSYSSLADPAEDAHFTVSNLGAITVTPEQSGRNFAYTDLASVAYSRLAALSDAAVAFSLIPEQPRVRAADATPLIPKAQAIANRAAFTLTFDEQSWTLDRSKVTAGLDLVAGPTGPTVGFTAVKLEDLFDSIAEAIDAPARDAKFAIKNGRVAEFQASTSGRAFDRAATVEEMNAAFVNGSGSSLIAVVREVAPSVTESEGADLGITELVAVGQTSFKGSPTNRRKNIANGARLLNGLLIKPGEEFSLLDALAPFELANGYLPELVIKGNRTIPEIGGGLCQIGTTMFRLVLNAGLPILERRNHSYRVSYYEPPVGMDATIYEPKPDFRFQNDYASHLLLQTRIEGDNLIFEFYGTKDSRKVEMTQPRVFNVVKPGPTKIIETTDLKPGERKCIERAHNGSDAEFTYTVTKPNGEVNSVVFRSHYVPWQEVCLVGVEKTPVEEKDAAPADTGAIGT